MNKRMISLLTLVGLLLIVTACNFPGSSGPTDCGEDMQCFIEAGENCDPAVVLFPLELDMMGVMIKSTTYQEIVGPEGDLCVVRFRTEEISIEYSQEAIDQMLATGMTQEMIDETIAQVEAQAQQGKLDETCRIDVDQLTAIMSQWEEGSFSTEDWVGMDCEGSVMGE